MKGLSQRKWKLIFIILLCIFIFAFLGNSKTASGIHASAKEIMGAQETAGDFSINISYGYSGIAKFGRYMSGKVNLYNKGEDFSGWLQVMTPTMQENAAYRQTFQIEAGAIEEAQFDIPVMDDTGILLVSLVNDKGKTVVEYQLPITVDNYQKQVNIGILSNRSEDLYYFDTEITRIFYLDNNNLADDYMGLDLLDIIVINDYETKNLSPKQISAIEQWVAKGGTLVLGTGENGDKTLTGWSIPLNNSGNLTTTSTSFGLNEERLDKLKQKIISYDEERKSFSKMLEERKNSINSAYSQTINYLYDYAPSDWAQNLIDNLRIQLVEKKILDVTLNETMQTVVEAGNSLMESSPLGLGMVQLFTFDLGMTEHQSSFGTAVAVEVLQNMSQTKQRQLTDEVYGKYTNYNIYTSMSYTDMENIPKISGYIIMIGIYLLTLSPILYLALKKLDKRNLIWIIVPVLAATFTLIIFMAGSGTRIKEPYIGYVQLLEFNEKDQVEENVYFSLTAPYNHQYSITLDGQYPIYQLSDSSSLLFNSGYPYRTGIIDTEYTTAIYYGKETTKLEVQNKPAFSPTYYTSENSYPMDNKLITDLSYTGDEITGKITNKFDFDLTNSMLLIDGNVVDLGKLPRGFSILAEGKNSELLVYEDLFNNSTIINQIAGGTGNEITNSAEVNRKLSVLRYILESKINKNSAVNYFIGFMKDSPTVEEDGLAAQLTSNLDSYGTRAVIIPIQVDHIKGNAEFVPSIQLYSANGNGFETGSFQAPVMIDSDVTIEYQLPVSDTIIALEYLPERNQYGQKDYWAEFEGDICALNLETGNFDLLFNTKELSKKQTKEQTKEQSNPKNQITDLANYINQQNQITLRYVTKQDNREKPMVMPDLSYWKEVK